MVNQKSLILHGDRKRRSPEPFYSGPKPSAVEIASGSIRVFDQAMDHYEAQLREWGDRGLATRWIINYYARYAHDEELGTVEEQTEVLRSIVGEFGERGWLAFYRHELVEHNENFTPPVNAIRSVAAFREMIGRRLTQAFGPFSQIRNPEGWVFEPDANAIDYENKHPLGNWPVAILTTAPTDYDSYAPGARGYNISEELPSETIAQALAARRWPVPVYRPTRRAADSGLASEVLELVRSKDFEGTIGELHQALRRDGHVMRTTRQLNKAADELTAFGVHVEPTGRDGPNRLVRYRIFLDRDHALEP